MTHSLKKILFITLCLLVALAPVVTAQAQETTGWAIRVSKVATLETPDSMNLKVYFSVYDPKTDLAILDFKTKSAQIALPNVNFITPADFKKPDVPIYITLLMDASGSMAGAATDLQKAAKLALNDSPDDSFFSVVQFNEDIKLLQDYTQNISAVSYAIDHYQVANKGTCLYDATYTAIEALQKAPPGRRAVILFTDGKDENFAGKPCSKHTYLEVSDFAQKSQVPVSTIGLSYKQGAADLNEVELKGIAASTGGYSAIGKQADLGSAFTNIMNGLKAQWMVETNVYPKKGDNQVAMEIKLKDDQVLDSTFNIVSNTEYPGPPSPVQGLMAGLEFKPEDLSYNIQLTTTSPELVDSVKVEVWDMKGGSKVAEYQFKDIQQNNTFNIPTSQLVTGRDYELRLTAVSKSDQTRFAWAKDSNGIKVVELVHPFTFDPTANLPSLEVQSVTQKNNDLLLAVKTTNSQLVGGFDGWLVDQTTNTQVPNSNFTSPALNSDSGIVTIPASKAKVPQGQYTAIVRVLGKNKQVYSTTKYEGIVYTPRLPNLIELLTAALIAAPIIIFLVIAIIVGVIGFLMYSSNREKSLSGTPVLQGRMGGKMRGGKATSGPVIPIADEPFQRKSNPPAVPPAQSGYVPTPAQPRPAVPVPARPVASEATIITPPVSSAPSGGSGETVLSFGAQMPRAVLTLLKAPPSIQPAGGMVVDQSPFILGRTQGQLIIPDPSISRQHARIDYIESSRTFTITDLNSSNGTRLNSQPLTGGQPAPLVSGSQVGLGPNVILRFDLI